MYQTYYGSDDLLLALGRELSPLSWPKPLAVLALMSFLWAPFALWALQWYNRRWSLALAAIVLFFPGAIYAYDLFDMSLSGWSAFDSWFYFWYSALLKGTNCFLVFWFFSGIGLVLWFANIVVARKTGRHRSFRSTRNLLVFSACLLLLTAAPTYYLAAYKTLEDAVRDGNLELAEKRLRSNLLGANANNGVSTGISSGPVRRTSVLPIAVRDNNTEMVRLLLEHGADVHDADTWPSDRPMMIACRESSLDIVEMLLDYGGDPNEGLHHAADVNRVDVLQLLIERGADVYTVGFEGRNLLDTAALAKAEDAVRFLSSGVDGSASEKALSDQSASRAGSP
ncbi:MAG: ankyrin repeat domain-containing protein [Candidatus Hydrogenedentes bacterium]|nr:ankyrin repeat domain-containing protein [Candidatus Hydrogenedentota bacterium]